LREYFGKELLKEYASRGVGLPKTENHRQGKGIGMQENRGTLQIFGLDLSLLLIRIKAAQGLSVRGSED
jgi:hypothetical protein